MSDTEDLQTLSFDELIRNIDVNTCPICGHISDAIRVHWELLRKAHDRLGITAASCLDCPYLFFKCLGEPDGTEEAMMAYKKFRGEPPCGTEW